MPGACRVGDTCSGKCDIGALCCPHNYDGGTCDNGSPSVFINGKAAVRYGDTGTTYCPHNGSFSSNGGSSTVFINGKKAARIGDSIVCSRCGESGSHTTGSGTVYIGG